MDNLIKPKELKRRLNNQDYPWHKEWIQERPERTQFLSAVSEYAVPTYTPQKVRKLSQRDADGVMWKYKGRPNVVHIPDYVKDRQFRLGEYDFHKDRVQMGRCEDYDNPEQYAYVLIHELAHSTGHRSRLGRESDEPHSVIEWNAREELVADFAYAVVMQYLNFPISHTMRGHLNEYYSEVSNVDTAIQCFQKGIEAAEFMLYESAKRNQESISKSIWERYPLDGHSHEGGEWNYENTTPSSWKHFVL